MIVCASCVHRVLHRIKVGKKRKVIIKCNVPPALSQVASRSEMTSHSRPQGLKDGVSVVSKSSERPQPPVPVGVQSASVERERDVDAPVPSG